MKFSDLRDEAQERVYGGGAPLAYTGKPDPENPGVNAAPPDFGSWNSFASPGTVKRLGIQIDFTQGNATSTASLARRPVSNNDPSVKPYVPALFEEVYNGV